MIQYPSRPATSTWREACEGGGVPHKLLNELCPGLLRYSQDAMQTLGEALPDTRYIYALPSGPLDALTEAETFANQMGMMLSHLNVETTSNKECMLAYGVQLDSQWGSVSRTQLLCIDMTKAKFDQNSYASFLAIWRASTTLCSSKSFGDMEDKYHDTMSKDSH